ncbi:putative transcriptional regulator [Candidatus Sulfopaludibacter sp. SbA6]|nr:putative transcriptional regulator [Candidatus Sulfopaludibacter sp. SbA6]
MSTILAEFEAWLSEPESERLEFKEAKSNFHFETLAKYCAALANEGGGKMILGVTDKRPRAVVGTKAFAEPPRTVAGLVERLRLKIECEEIQHRCGRVLIFHVPSRPIGMAVEADGAFWMRAGESLRAMTQDEVRRIVLEAGPDYSAETCPEAGISDLDLQAVERFRGLWMEKSGNASLARTQVEQVLEDAELLRGGRITHAALILFGTHKALGRHLAQAETIFEYRSSESSIPYQQRLEFRQGFFTALDELWKVINLRNEVQQYQDGLFVKQIPTFNERVVREAILNAVTHRDYRLAGSVFIRQFPQKLEIVSPGGLPAGITLENILNRQLPRNRRVAEACGKCHLVERSGQGIDLMFRNLIEEGKPRPDFTGTDDHQVSVTLCGEVRNPQFLRFLERVGLERQTSFGTMDLITLDYLQRQEPVPEAFKPGLEHLLEEGVIERIGRGRGVRFLLSRRFYSFLGRRGRYTREKGLNRETQKELLVRHIRESEPEGARLADLQDVLRDLSRKQVQTLLRELRDGGRVTVVGVTRSGRWHPAQKDSSIAPNPKERSNRRQSRSNGNS